MIKLFEITVGTHFFQVRPRHADEKAKELCYSFVRKFVKVDVQGNNKTITTFAASNRARTWFRFHYNTLAEFNNHLFVNNITKEQVDVTYLPEPVVPECKMPIRKEWEVRDYQEPIIDYLTKPVGKYDAQTRTWVEGSPRARLVGIQTGKGKSVAVATPVKTPNGWTNIGDLKVGDVITAWDGAPTVVTGVFPQGKLKAYEVVFQDGRTLSASIDHLWGAYEDGVMERKPMTTKEVEAVILRGGSVCIDLHKAVTPEANEAWEAFVRKHGKVAEMQQGNATSFMVKLPKLEAEEAAEMIWAAGHKCRIIPVTPEKSLLSVVPSVGTFSSDTSIVCRVNPLGEQEMVCISIDHPDKQFIAGKWIVTHNTFCALKAIGDVSHKVAIVVPAQYVEKWVKDLTKTMDIKAKQVLAVQGGAAMQALTQMAVTEGSMEPYKAIVISNRTFDNYIKAFEMYGSEMDTMGYLVEPDNLWQKLGIGVRLVDEVHMQFHANFRLDLYTNVLRSISLSATLVTRDETLNRMYKVAYPPNERYHEGPIDKYIESYGVMYRVNPNWNVKTSNRGMSSYSHTAFEDSVLKNKAFLDGYATMVGDYLSRGYIANYKPGHKAIVFAASVDLCGKIAGKLQERFPDKTVKRYVAEDPYQENYLDPDIRVTTIGSGGTGHDIPGLTDNHMTTAIDSIQANIQAMGRLRKRDDNQTRFYFYSCEQIRKHLGYHEKKKVLMKERAKSYTPLFYGTIGEQGWD